MEKLIQLQGIDTKLRDLNDLLGDLPSNVELLNQQEESTKNSLDEKKKRLKELDKQKTNPDDVFEDLGITKK